MARAIHHWNYVGVTDCGMNIKKGKMSYASKWEKVTCKKCLKKGFVEVDHLSCIREALGKVMTESLSHAGYYNRKYGIETAIERELDDFITSDWMEEEDNLKKLQRIATTIWQATHVAFEAEGINGFARQEAFDAILRSISVAEFG